jgi:hypothetical protein
VQIIFCSLVIYEQEFSKDMFIFSKSGSMSITQPSAFAAVSGFMLQGESFVREGATANSLYR